MDPLKERLIGLFQERGWSYHQFDENMIYTDCKDEALFYRILFSIGREEEYLIMYISSPLFVPLSHRSCVMEYICRVNYHLPLGHFEIHMDRWSVRYRMALQVENSLSSPLLSSMVLTGGTIYEHYWPGLLEIIKADRDPSEIFNEKVGHLSYHEC